MIGNNIIHMNPATVIEAVEEYWNSRLTDKIKVTQIDWKDDGQFEGLKCNCSPDETQYAYPNAPKMPTT